MTFLTTTAAARVLVVDDDPSVRELTALVVTSGGHRAIGVGSVADALAEIDRRPVDLVVTDLHMPDAGGLELLAALSARPGAPPVVVVSGSAEESELRAARLLGARSVVAKPFGFAELRREIAAALSPERLLASAA
jgi:CheY-like chemotaxis protein